ncbi:MAG TPA: hypothetical protein VKZ89_22470, partial [Thermobifida alba]|nr:hypothetical protein [Thermobifida alba]
VLSGEPHGSTAVEDHDPADGTTGDGDAPEETPETRSEDDAAADTSARDSADEPEAPAEETPEADPDAAADTGSRDAAVAGTAVDEPEARTTGPDDSDAAAADGPDGAVAETDTAETDAVAFREPAEWNPPFTLPSKEQRENKNVSAAAIAALAARWTPTGDDLASEAETAETAPTGSDDAPSTGSDGDAPAADTPRGSTAVPKDPED